MVVVVEFSTQLVSKLDTCLLTIACCYVMERILLFQLLLWVVPWFWVSPSLGGEPYSWRRPVPGWRQSKESVTLVIVARSLYHHATSHIILRAPLSVSCLRTSLPSPDLTSKALNKLQYSFGTQTLSIVSFPRSFRPG